MTNYPNVPAVPIYKLEALKALVRLAHRTGQTKPAKKGLSNEYTIDGETAAAYDFVFGSNNNPLASINIKSLGLIGVLAVAAKKAIDYLKSESEDDFGRGSAGDEDESDDDPSDVNVDQLNTFTAELKKLEKEFSDDSDFDVDQLHALLEEIEKLEKTFSDNSKLEEIFNDPSHFDGIEKELIEKYEKDDDDDDDFGRGAASETALTELSLEKPEQWTMGWTNYLDIYKNNQETLPHWTSTLTDADKATQEFWPTIANYGLVYNLLVLQKVSDAQYDQLKAPFKLDGQLSAKVDNLQKAGRLYAIDLSVFQVLKPNQVGGAERFTPSTITLLQQDADSKAITPLAIRVAGYEGTNAQVYLRDSAAGEKQATDSAWLYALQAAKASVTVYGIWLGHVYHWHIVTAAMQMTMKTGFGNTWWWKSNHPIAKLLAPQSECLIGFDTLLIKFWRYLAPPTSINSGDEYLQLCNAFAENRTFFDDDPLVTLQRLGIDEADFTKNQSWDLYPIVPEYLKMWQHTKTYVKTFVDQNYQDDQKVKDDDDLQRWITLSKSSSPNGGNIKSLPEMNSRQALKDVLTSLIYRVTMHGVSRLNSDAMPVLSFVANFPPCLQSSDIPEPSASFDTKTLLSYLPKTGTIGGMLNFYFIFVFSDPYKPFIPKGGIKKDLFFKNEKCNDALINYRRYVEGREKAIQVQPDKLHQWPLNIET